ncbi:hypothetical protein [Myxococcus phage Mx1]|nr:hypothetical protein [Myxococcus phage Mx1]
MTTVQVDNSWKTNNGFLAYVSKKRREEFENAPAKLYCNGCKATKPKKEFGVRTFKDKEGKPNRWAMQSYCTPCRSKGTKKEARAAARKAVAAKMAKAVKSGKAKEVATKAAPVKAKAPAVKVRKAAKPQVQAGPQLIDLAGIEIVPA